MTAGTQGMERPASYEPVQRFRIDVVAGPDTGNSFTSSSPRVVIGSHQSADLILTDPTVSRFHVEIAIDGGRAVVRDLGSRNGTRVGGVQVVIAMLDATVTLALGHTELRYVSEPDPVRVPLSERDGFGRMVGSTRTMRAAFAALERSAESDATVLLLGETGVGKDLAAESIHEQSARRNGPFVGVDCGAIAGPQLESELFGHEKGAFAGADARRIGACELASGGTLFLDEVGELPLELQPVLLRALERRELRRVGGDAPIPFDVRVIASTQRDLRAEVNAGRFRADVYYRLAVVEVTLPPLRDRMEDIPRLVDAIIANAGATASERAAKLDLRALYAQLAHHRWPGNVRELRNAVERALLLDASVVPFTPTPELRIPVDADQPLRIERERWLREVERQYVEAVLAKAGDNVPAAAKLAGLNRTSFYRLLTRVRRPSG